jgi:hypothetical protein
MALRALRASRNRVILPALVFGCALAAFAACSSESDPETASGPSTSSAGGGTTSSTTTTSTASSGGGSGPIVCMAPYTDVIKDECDMLQQDCGPGLTCRPVETANGWRTKCRNGPGLKGPGKSCITDNECEAGLFCIGAPNSWCAPICCPSNNEPCGNGACNSNVTLVGMMSANAFVMMCSFSPQCELLTENACKVGEECHLSDASQGLATCIPPSDAQVEEGGSCAFLNDCKNMQHCTDPPDRVCRYYCLLSPQGGEPLGLGGCPANQMCAPANLGVQGIGVCQTM